MRINEIGGEFALIERLREIVPFRGGDLLQGIGDDAAVIRINQEEDRYLLVTTDTLVSGTHFNISWASARQIGIKSAECNLSDIAAMGGRPGQMFVSLVLPEDTTVEWVESLYDGIGLSCSENQLVLAGGDITRGESIIIGITLLGYVSQKNLCLRSHAVSGDLLAVTGTLGASAAGLQLKQRKFPITPYLLKKHLTPGSRLDAAQKLAPLVNAMIDISDGIAADTIHICSQSSVGARLFAKKIPLHTDVIEAGAALGVNPLEFALNGGEDFELLFTVSPQNMEKLKKTGMIFHVVGEIIDNVDEKVLISESLEKIPLKGGYDHFEP